MNVPDMKQVMKNQPWKPDLLEVGAALASLLILRRQLLRLHGQCRRGTESCNETSEMRLPTVAPGPT